MYKKLVVGVDGYSASLEAAKRAIQLASQYGSKLVALYVREQIPLYGVEKAEEMVEKRITDKPLDLVRVYAKKHGVDIETRVEEGAVAACILKVAKESDADLIVVGDTGRKGFKKFYLGSVAQAVAEKAHCPVLVVKKGTTDISDMYIPIEETKEAKVEEIAKVEIDETVFKSKAKTAFLLSSIFAVIYFIAATLTSEPMKDVAGTNMLGLPLAIWIGMVVIVCGIVVARYSIMKI